jgi:hypothetical protein
LAVWRKTHSRNCGAGGVFAFAGAITFTTYKETGYISYLASTFCWFLSLFHAGYAYAQNLTQRQVRKIDYWYLGAASLGALDVAFDDLPYENADESAQDWKTAV